MTPPNLIRADYPTLERVATTFDDERDRVHRVLESVARHVSLLKGGGWVGDAADGFYREMDDDLLPSLARLMSALGAAGDTTRRIVQIMRQAEQEAAAAMRGTDEVATNGDAVTRQDSSQTDNEKLRVRYSPLFQETTPEPVPEQQTVLGELGITIPEGTVLTAEEAQALLDFYTAHPGLIPEGMTLEQAQQLAEQVENLTSLGVVVPDDASFTTDEAQAVIDFYNGHEGLVEDGLTFAVALEVTNIVNRIEAMGFCVDVSTFNGRPWTVDELRFVDGIIDTIAETTAASFIETYGEDALIRFAYSMGISPERVNDATLMLLVEGQRAVYIDDGHGQTETVAYMGGINEETGEPYVLQAYPSDRATTQAIIAYDPEPDAEGNIFVERVLRQSSDGSQPIALPGQAIPENQLETVLGDSRDVVYFGRAATGGAMPGVIFSDRVLRGGTFDSLLGLSFTAEGLVAHEFSHLVDLGASTEAQAALGTDTAGLPDQPRSGNEDFEIRPDILANGFLGIITDPEQQARFDTFLEISIAENYNPEDYEDVELPEDYINQAPE